MSTSSHAYAACYVLSSRSSCLFGFPTYFLEWNDSTLPKKRRPALVGWEDGDHVMSAASGYGLPPDPPIASIHINSDPVPKKLFGPSHQLILPRANAVSIHPPSRFGTILDFPRCRFCRRHEFLCKQSLHFYPSRVPATSATVAAPSSSSNPLNSRPPLRLRSM